jgi:uncharacterized protein YjlB
MLINDPISAAGSEDVIPLFRWQGWSGRWYIASVANLSKFDCPAEGVFIVVRRDRSGERTPLLVGLADNVSDELFNDHGDALMRSIKAGANEVHVHLAAESRSLRGRIVEDIASGWNLSVSVPARPLVDA